jgi:hypothetical protein
MLNERGLGVNRPWQLEVEVVPAVGLEPTT